MILKTCTTQSDAFDTMHGRRALSKDMECKQMSGMFSPDHVISMRG